ncbi:hypothetical protein GIB67_004213 [Kingdonia uniflora]|uniref:Uncharacterized protein n=1 Tax=Kingdonia uniflora TaxID=39325 RepID=A0A7J7P1A4_9MAGN|nr:hypothetical protein GIB67_004213 [Kingdonia uniflora]
MVGVLLRSRHSLSLGSTTESLVAVSVKDTDKMEITGQKYIGLPLILLDSDYVDRNETFVTKPFLKAKFYMLKTTTGDDLVKIDSRPTRRKRHVARVVGGMGMLFGSQDFAK